jgi:hypothetical protein
MVSRTCVSPQIHDTSTELPDKPLDPVARVLLGAARGVGVFALETGQSLALTAVTFSGYATSVTVAVRTVRPVPAKVYLDRENPANFALRGGRGRKRSGSGSGHGERGSDQSRSGPWTGGPVASRGRDRGRDGVSAGREGHG